MVKVIDNEGNYFRPIKNPKEMNQWDFYEYVKTIIK